MKHKLLVASLTILSTCTLMACSHTTQKDTAASSTKESSSKVEKQTSSSSSKDTSFYKENHFQSRNQADWKCRLWLHRYSK